MEEWRPVVGFEGAYEVSSLGKVRSLSRRVLSRDGRTRLSPGKELARSTHSTGYLVVGLSVRGVQKNRLVHCLVAEAFIGPRPEMQEVRHLDGDKQNCALSNLAYGTKAENAADKVAHGTANQGDTNPRAKLFAEDVLEIFKRCELGEDQTRVAAELNVSPITVNHIATGRTWGSVTGKRWQRSHTVVTPAIVRSIDSLQKAGRTLDEIAVELGISKASAFRYSKGKRSLMVV